MSEKVAKVAAELMRMKVGGGCRNAAAKRKWEMKAAGRRQPEKTRAAAAGGRGERERGGDWDDVSKWLNFVAFF